MTMLAKWIRKATNLLSEPDKNELKADDFAIEHVLFYHGLVGSSPESSRAFKDVRADFHSAVARNNSQNLCICLRLPPLHWEDKLKKIVDEIKGKSREDLIQTLLPPNYHDRDKESHDPLHHSDWQVRANAALILAHISAEQAVDRLIASLEDTASNTSPAFCHIARSLAALRTETAHQALTKFADHREPWIRVDAVSALSTWPLEMIKEPLARSFASHHQFFDYQSVAVAKHHRPAEFIKGKEHDKINDQTGDIGLEIAIGLVEAFRSTFAGQKSMAAELGLPQVAAVLSQTKLSSPLAARTLHQVLTWLEENDDLNDGGIDWPSEAQLKAGQENLQAEETTQAVLAVLQEALKTAPQTQAESASVSKVRHAVKLAGELEIAAAYDSLIQLLDSCPVYRDEAVEALGRLGKPEAATALVKLARHCVKMEDRTGLPLSPQPIQEKDARGAETYWHILQALGNISTTESLNLLLEAASDSAPDKRQAALDSAIKLFLKTNGQLARSNEVKTAVIKSLNDPSTAVRTMAAQACARMNLSDAIPSLSKLALAGEISLARAALDSLTELAAAGEKEKVVAALTEAARAERNGAKSKRILDFVESKLK